LASNPPVSVQVTQNQNQIHSKLFFNLKLEVLHKRQEPPNIGKIQCRVVLTLLFKTVGFGYCGCYMRIVQVLIII
jgi:hypothetical protein